MLLWGKGLWHDDQHDHHKIDNIVAMQRRTVSTNTNGKSVISSTAIMNGGSSSTARRTSRSSGKLLSNCALLIIALILTVATYVIPDGSASAGSKLITAENRVMEAEGRWMQSVSDAEGAVMDEIHHWLYEQKPNAATERMLQQSSKWVDGEKKLKSKLKELAVLQSQGKELGVPVATRWLGDDIPAWAGEGVDVEQWRKKVDARYAEMRKEEENWIEMVSATLQTNQG